MITILSHFFIPEDMPENQKRGAYGMLCGVVGILLNLLLSAGKFCAGWMGGSIAITADAFNNLSDAGSSIVTLAGFKLAELKPDSDHPFGHGRMEYISGLVVAAVILFMAIELIRDSIEKILHPQETQLNALIVGILLASILVKCYMAFYNHSIGIKIHSATVLAVCTDSLSDAAATFVVLLSALAGHFTNLHVDGYCGVLVGCFIFYAGFCAARDTLNPLLGQPPEKEFVERIENIVLDFDENISGVHDLIVHDYGPGRRIISLHVEVPVEGDLRKLHDIIDNLEKKLSEEMGCLTTIHMDPIETKDEHVNELKDKLLVIVHDIDPVITMHDFRVVAGESHTNMIFDIVVPYDFRFPDEKLKELVQKEVSQRMGKDYFTVIEVDKDAFLKSK